MTFDPQTNIWQGRQLMSFFDDHGGCKIIRKDRNKILLKVQSMDGDKKSLFVKIYMYPTWWNRVKAQGRISPGIRDFRICRRLQTLEVPVPDPIGAVEENTRLGFPKRSLYACQWMDDAIALRDLVVGMYQKRSGEKELFHKLNVEIGSFVAELHLKGVIPSDLNSGNLLVRQLDSDKDHFEFLLIDYEDIFFSNAISFKQRLSSLIQISAFMLPSAENAPWSICSGYSQTHKDFDEKVLAFEVNERARKRQAYWKRKLDERFRNIAREIKKSSQ